MQPAPRTLILMRHAKAESVAASDEERSLTDAGRADARGAGRWLGSQEYAVDRALVSSAVRTRQTWEAVEQGAGVEAPADFDGSVYAGGPETVHDLIRMVDDEVSSLLVIGHNPTIASLAQLLDDGEGDPEAVSAMSGGFPPAGVVVLSVPTSWRDLDVGGARVVAFHVGAAD